MVGARTVQRWSSGARSARAETRALATAPLLMVAREAGGPKGVACGYGQIALEGGGHWT